MPNRPDITDNLVHFISAETDAAALEILWRIVSERRILGSKRMIRGGFNCACFTETPISLIRETLLDAEENGHRYKPFGISVSKGWLFDQGGRPVMYGPDDQYLLLPVELRWRHMRYEPTSAPPIDFTWEREWRAHLDELPIHPTTATLIVPNDEAASEIESRHDAEEHQTHEAYVQAYGDLVAGLYGGNPFPWTVRVI